MLVNKQLLIDIAPKFFWTALRSVPTFSATKNNSNSFWSAGDQSDQTLSEFFIQWPVQALLVDKKSFQATEVSFMIISTNPASQLFCEHCCTERDL